MQKLIDLTLILTALLTTVSAASRPLLHDRRLLAEEVTCRGESVCLRQGICTKGAYEYNLETAGEDFPYSVSYTKTASLTTTTFVFVLCSTANKLYGGCPASDPACAGLKTFQLRTRDDLLALGRTIDAVPSGSSWVSCSPYGPGQIWQDSDLGKLTTAGSKNDTCATFTVTLNQQGTLADICQQDVEIVTKQNGVVFKQPTGKPSCFVILETNSGRIAYGVIGDASRPQATSAEISTPSKAPAPLPARPQATSAVIPTPSKAPTPLPARPQATSAVVPTPSKAPTPLPARPQAYGPARRRRLRASQHWPTYGRVF
jgi:hypothetical protein